MIILRMKKDTYPVAAEVDAEKKSFENDYSTRCYKRQEHSVEELLRMREEANVIHSTIFDLESAYRTIFPVNLHSAAEIKNIIAPLKAALAAREKILDKYTFM